MSQRIVIRVVRGPEKGRAFEFNKNIVTVGRDPANDVAFSADSSVASTQVEIRRKGSAFTLVDRSGGGTLVNNRRVEQMDLSGTVSIRLGSASVIEFNTGTAEAGAGASAAPLLRRPLVRMLGAAYLALMIVLFAVLSSTPATSDSPTPGTIATAYREYLAATGVADADRRIEQLHNYLRAAQLAESAGRLGEAQRIYLELIARHHRGLSPVEGVDDPVYTYAISRLEALQ